MAKAQKTGKKGANRATKGQAKPSARKARAARANATTTKKSQRTASSRPGGNTHPRKASNDLPAGFKMTALGPLPDEWDAVPLGEAIQQRKETIRIDDLDSYKRCRVQVRGKGIVLRDSIKGESLRIKQQQVCRGGDFLVAEIDAKVGGFGIIPPQLEGAIVSSHYFLFHLDSSKLAQRFLHYYVRLPQFLGQVQARGSTNYASVRPKHVLTYRIPLPPIGVSHQPRAMDESGRGGCWPVAT